MNNRLFHAMMLTCFMFVSYALYTHHELNQRFTVGEVNQVIAEEVYRAQNKKIGLVDYSLTCKK